MGAEDEALEVQQNFMAPKHTRSEYVEDGVWAPPLDSTHIELTSMRGDKNKFDGGKAMWDLLPWDAVEEIVQILTFGATKYGAYSWKEVDGARDRYMAALMRHVKAWYAGEEFDPESGQHHLAHAGCNLLFLLQGAHESLPEFILEGQREDK